MSSTLPVWLLLATSFALGLRHGVDWDHISAIMDITSSRKRARESVVLGWFYAGGHGTVVAVLGLAAVLLGLQLPPEVDLVMGYFVGLTLIILSIYVMNMVVRHPEQDIRMRSRWVLIGTAASRLYRRLASRVTGKPIVQKPERSKVYGPASAYAIGIIHGIGGETPTQILLFLLAVGVGQSAVAVPVVILFILGVFVTNSIMSVLAAFGYARAADRPHLFRYVASGAAVFSFVIGAIFLAGASGLLPTLG